MFLGYKSLIFGSKGFKKVILAILYTVYDVVLAVWGVKDNNRGLWIGKWVYRV